MLKPLDLLDIIDIIGRKLQEKMTYKEIDAYLAIYGIDTENVQIDVNSKWVYTKEALAGVNNQTILDIAKELEVDHPAITHTRIVSERDTQFWKPGHFRLFISHIAKNKDKALALKKALENFGISAFVAHEDVKPAKEWQLEIENALFSMDALAAILAPGFRQSAWTDQEVGTAFGRNVLIIPILKNETPYGFLGKYQGFDSLNKTVGQVAYGVFEIIGQNPKTAEKIADTLVNLILLANNAQQAITRVKLLRNLSDLPEPMIQNLHYRISENKQLNDTSFLKEVNLLFEHYGMRPIRRSYFSRDFGGDDDLPF